MVDLLLGYLRKSLDEFSMTGTPGSDCAAAAAIETPSSAIVARRRSWP